VGIALISVSGYSIISAFFIFLLAVITSYMKSIGLIIFWLYKKYKISSFILADNLINIMIMVLFGYKYIIILNFELYAYASYIILWSIYILVVYLKMIRNINYFT
jgi:hypothetical protein